MFHSPSLTRSLPVFVTFTLSRSDLLIRAWDVGFSKSRLRLRSLPLAPETSHCISVISTPTPNADRRGLDALGNHRWKVESRNALRNATRRVRRGVGARIAAPDRRSRLARDACGHHEPERHPPLESLPRPACTPRLFSGSRR
jgi:hypothetical protein